MVSNSTSFVAAVGALYAAADEPSWFGSAWEAVHHHLAGAGVAFPLVADLAGIAAALRAVEHGRVPQAVAELREHADRAATLGARLAGPQPEEVLSIVAAAMPLPALITDVQGRCLERNAPFGRAAGALGFHLALNRVRFADPALQQSWDHALFECGETAAPRAWSSEVGRQSWQVQLIPVPGGLLAGGARLVLALFDDRPPAASAAALRTRAGLTQAESEVLGALMQGLPAKAIAARRGASVNTVRAQIMAILDKTGHASQKELMAAAGASSFGSSFFEAGHDSMADAFPPFRAGSPSRAASR